ncbi:DNA polymerase delta subunit 2 [Chironomus tepperi]|uniref:DNA polymerase delta subunit 2 n=1 Tax=Chironomus tepperi TaxID=113505 RepID=UPI00391F67AA
MARISCTYENQSSKFYRNDQDFQRQFFHIYESRLNQLGDLLKQKISAKYGTKYPVKMISDLSEDNPAKCILIGNIYKHMELKPSILKEIAEENQLTPLPPPQDYNQPSDELILEDSIQRIKLCGKVNIAELVTGIVVAALGYTEGAGKFQVEELILYESGPELPLKVLDTSPLLVFISGIDLANTESPSLPLDLFQQWVYGNLEMGSSPTQYCPSNVVRIVIAGNSTRANAPKKQKNVNSTNLRAIDTKGMVESVRTFDEFLFHLSQSVSVDVMPGEFDPSNIMLPQQPFHHCLFPRSSVNRALTGVPNPYQFAVEDRIILGTSGQNIKDIMKYSTTDDPLECMKNTLKWSHLAPTCPDTLPCYPYYDQDPFIITDCPHVYFSAYDSNVLLTEIYENSNGQKTRLVCIPSFQKSQTIAIVNLNTLECDGMSFSMAIDMDEE